jgi:hypothetical protein
VAVSNDFLLALVVVTALSFDPHREALSTWAATRWPSRITSKAALVTPHHG